MCQVLHEVAKDGESTKSLPLQAEQNEYFLVCPPMFLH